MTISKKVLGLALGAVLVSNVSVANAAPQKAPAAPAGDRQEELLFKIHDVKPVKNREGDVIACDFYATFYNRSPYELKSAVVEYKWHDKSIDSIITAEKEADAEKKGRNVNRSYSETERLTEKYVSATVEVPLLKSYKQVTVEGRVNSDRCFLLIEDVDFSVKNCAVEGMAGGARASGRRSSRGSNCEKMFKYISPADAQYHLDFKEITLDEESAKEAAQQKEKMEEISDTYTKTVKKLDEVSSVISGIK